MKQSATMDVQCLERIINHIGSIKKAFEFFKIRALTDFVNSDVCQLAVTQAITNISELRRKLSTDTLDKLILFSKMGIVLKTARNIAGHDYEMLDFGIIFDTANKLQRKQLLDEMEVMIDELADDKQGD